MKDVISLGQEAASWITGDAEIAKETKTLEDAIKAIKTALELGRESHVKYYQTKDELEKCIKEKKDWLLSDDYRGKDDKETND